MTTEKIMPEAGELQGKIARVAALLESAQGVPRRRRRSDPLETLVVTVLSQNTSDLNRDRAYQSLRERFRSWDELARAAPSDIAAAIRAGGLANQKGRRIKELLAWVRERFGGWDMGEVCRLELEEALELLVSVDGVGVKTAAVVLLFACGRDVFPVDTHVHRLCRRLGLVPENFTAEATFQRMRALVPPGKSHSLHLNLIRFGRERCRARNPICCLCPLDPDCIYPCKNKNPPPG